MKPETKRAGLPWGPLEGKSSKQPYCNAFSNLILARDVTVLGCTGSLGWTLQTFHALMEKDLSRPQFGGISMPEYS